MSPSGATSAGFVARVFESPSIKSPHSRESTCVRSALAAALDAVRNGSPLVLDFLAEFDSANMEKMLAQRTVLHWRHRPSATLGARLRRRLGILLDESSLAAAVEMADGRDIEALLPDSILEEGEFTVYPLPKRPPGELANPHFAIAQFAVEVEWTLNQDLASSAWLLTARQSQVLERLEAALGSAFDQQGLKHSSAPAPREVFESSSE